MSDSIQVFVYGSLMRGLKYSRLMHDATFQGMASTEEPYALYDLGPYPAASPGGDCPLHGELYEIDVTTLARLDQLEGHPELYRRSVRSLSDGSSAWLYEIVLNTETQQQLTRAPQVAGGDWRGWLALRGST